MIRQALEHMVEIVEDYATHNDLSGETRAYLYKAASAGKAALDPATEEPVSIPTDLNQHYKANTVSLNDWRELGQDEEICELDEFQEKQYDPIKNKWHTIYACSMVGKKVSDSDWGRFRTRRPLPTTNHKQISSKLVDEPKQEMPLEGDVQDLEEIASEKNSGVIRIKANCCQNIECHPLSPRRGAEAEGGRINYA